jgi:hypothetical protein
MTRRGALIAMIVMGAAQEQLLTIPAERLLRFGRIKTVTLILGGAEGFEKFIVEAPEKRLEFTAEEILAALERG